MDPIACIVRLLNAISDEDFDEAEAALSDLHDWRTKHGYLPALNIVATQLDEYTRTGTLFIRLSGARHPD